MFFKIMYLECILFVYTFAMVKKDKNIIIRVSPEEKNDFERAAEISGLSMSAWMRIKLRSSALADLNSIGEKPKFLNERKDS